MKILTTADWQVSPGNLHRCELMLKHLLEVAHNEKVDAVLHLGDVKDAFNPVDVNVTNFMVRATRKITKIAPFHVLLGNHDHTSTSDESASCMPVLRAAGALTYEKPTWVQFKSTWVYFVPYYRDRKVLLDHLTVKDSLIPGQKLLAFHAEINGCKMSRHVGAEGKGGIPIEGLWPDDYALCLGGHIHYQQKCADNVWYVGSPFQQNWGEANHPCGFLLVETSRQGSPIIQKIPSRVPGYIDPDLKGFDDKAPTKSQLRVRVNCNLESDPGVRLQNARKEAEAKYPRFQIHVVPVVEGVDKLKVFDQSNAAGDEDMIRRYLKQTKTEEPEAVAACILYHLRKRGMGVTGLDRLRFLKVTAENVLSYEKCEVALAGKGITLVTGENRDWGGDQEARSNGSGKTSALSLPLIALFGKTPKGQTADAWARQGCKDPSKVSLSLLLSDGREVNVTRCRPSSLELRVAGKLIGSGDARETQRAIEKLLNLTWDVATNALYIGQREVGTILTGTDKERKELFSRFLGLDRFLMVQEDLRLARRKTEAAIQETQSAIDVVVGQIEQVTKSLSDPVDGYSPDVCTRNLEKTKKEYEKLGKFLKTMEAEWKRLHGLLKTVSEKHRKEEQASAVAFAAQSEATGRLGELRVLSKQSVCPTCSSILTVKGMRKLIEAFERKAEEAKAERAKCAKSEVLVDAERNKLEKKKLEVEREMSTTNSQMASLQTLESVWKERHQAAFEHASQRQRQRDEIKRLESRRWLAINYQSQLMNRSDFLVRCLETVGRNGLPAYLCGSICPALNSSALRFSELFTGGALGVQFAFFEGDLDIQVENRHGGAGINDQSQGEMRMIGLIAAFALRDVLVPYNLLILDEPGEGLDAVNAKAFADGLSEVTERFGSLFVVTHNTHILAALEPTRRLHVIKENQISRLEEIV